MKYIPEKSMEKTNGLSRRPNWKAGVKRDNKDRKLLKLE